MGRELKSPSSVGTSFSNLGGTMPIHREGQHLVNSDLQGNLLIGMESESLQDCIAEAKRRHAYGVFGNPEWGFHEQDLDCLADLSDIKSVWFWDVNLRDIEGLYRLTGLRSFGVHSKRPPVDFGRLPTLESIVWHYNARDRGLERLTQLRQLSIWHSKLKTKTLQSVTLPRCLEDLEFVWSNIVSLVGLPEFPKLRRMAIHRCRNLEGIKGLPQIAPHLEHLTVANCGRVKDGAEVVRQMPSLRFASVQGVVLVKP
jgi:hypothetical protein